MKNNLTMIIMYVLSTLTLLVLWSCGVDKSPVANEENKKQEVSSIESVELKASWGEATSSWNISESSIESTWSTEGL